MLYMSLNKSFENVLLKTGRVAIQCFGIPTLFHWEQGLN